MTQTPELPTMTPPAADAQAPTLDPMTRWLPVIPALILALLVGLYAYRLHALDQCAWSGVGFGMFARVDGYHTRFVQITGRTATGARRLDLPPQAEQAKLEATTVPTPEKLDALASTIMTHAPADVQAIDVTLLRLRYDPNTRRLHAEPMRTAHATR